MIEADVTCITNASFTGLLAEKSVDIKRGGYNGTSRGVHVKHIGRSNGYSVNISQIDLTQFPIIKHTGETPACKVEPARGQCFLVNHPKTIGCRNPDVILHLEHRQNLVVTETTQVHRLNLVATRIHAKHTTPKARPDMTLFVGQQIIWFIISGRQVRFYMRNLTSPDIDFVNSVVV